MAGEPERPGPEPDGDEWVHADLIDRVPHYRSTDDALPLSAVVTPTTRAEGLGSNALAVASWIAAAKDARLVVIRGGEARGRRFPQVLVPATSWRTAVVDLSPGATSILPEWESSRHSLVPLSRAVGVVGFKRNLGILLGRMCGWSATLILGDDLRVTPAPSRPAATGGDGPIPRLDHVLTNFARDPRLLAASYFAQDGDDNGVVRQARKLAGEDLEIVVPGGALAVRSDAPLPFVPSLGHEEWIFLFHLLLGDVRYPSPAVKYVGTMRRDAYYPFAVPRGAETELADLFAQGLYALLQRPMHEVLLQASSPAYWSEVAWRRQEEILRLLSRLRTDCAGPGMSLVHEAEAALRAALAVYPSVDEVGFELADLFAALLRDLDTWTALLRSVTGDRLLEDALKELSLQEFTTWLDPPGHAVTP